MSLELTEDGINEFFEVFHSIDNSLKDIHGDLDGIFNMLDDVVIYLSTIRDMLDNSNPKDN